MRKKLLDQLPEFQPDHGGWITKDFYFELITPMFGGDSKSWEINEQAPVRAQSVKGQLRFWWRTMQNENNFHELLRKENALWGGKISADTDESAQRIQSRVKISIHDQRVLSKSDAQLNERGVALQDGAIPTYVAFPVIDAVKNHGIEVKYIEKASFTLRVTFQQSDEAEVMNTLKLWTLFGGVGARTRRGCGSVYCEKLMKDFSSSQEIFEFIKSRSHDQEALSYCRLSGARLAWNKSSSEAAGSWRKLIENYMNFRQDRVPSKPSKPRPGRSYWPEPDAIRKVTGQASASHAPRHPAEVWFPRAAFGLPIITKFNTQDKGQGDPDPQVELSPEDGGRWPSPVIIKVIRTSSGDILNIALILDQRLPNGLRLRQGREEFPLDTTALPFPENNRPIIYRDGRPTVTPIYEAFFQALNLREMQ